jgi:hypothetical protein
MALDVTVACCSHIFSLSIPCPREKIFLDKKFILMCYFRQNQDTSTGHFEAADVVVRQARKALSGVPRNIYTPMPLFLCWFQPLLWIRIRNYPNFFEESESEKKIRIRINYIKS